MNDEEFLQAFESRTIAPADFDHESHVRLTFAMLARWPPARAEAAVREGLRAFAAHAGRPGIYDDQLTTVWIERIRARLRPGDTWEVFRERERELFVRTPARGPL